ncbi:enoyl-CoA hydratase/isomerase family protein [Georgenia sp. SYP-B2076]|uniref:enoyl-CoA hydratase/isomerase family protein n=1 Tax=Georgenia sp. SYP-B2076 TaxID=2495881 RepID=UPI000F8EB12F|nr:enoyl-CoA hydratase/isomerase family protein [Georgenia sp. SYP-B2076]
MNATDDAVLLERRGALGLITLNRPRAINALTHEMVRLVSDALDRWEHDDGVRTVAITGAGDRGLCAGGDVVALYEAATVGPPEPAVEFWADEYTMNARIAAYPKPVVAIQDGLVLGGGIGISAHASHRIVTERSRLGFPEVTIGFVPDVGGTWLLSRSPGELGTRLALTGAHVGAADAILVGLSDHFVPAADVAALLGRLESEEPDSAVAAVRADPGPAPLAAERELTDRVFARTTVPEILSALGTDGPERAIRETIAAKSPTALTVTLEAVRRARALDSLEEALEQEFRVSTRHLTTPDFTEGIRAQVVDKDRSPAWRPATLGDVTADLVETFFQESPWSSFRSVRVPSKETS